MSYRFAFFLPIFTLLIWSCSSRTLQPPLQQDTTAEVALQRPLPMDTSITIGRLENGLVYYIRKNREPQNRAELRLAVNAGSILEDENQRGLAHFVEHMAFNGTEHFQKQELVNYLESIGMRFGPDLNAYTSFDETVYMLQIPTDSAAIVDTAFEVLEEWAHRVSFDTVEIDKERGVVVEEWRLGRGANARMLDRQLPVLLKGSRYAERLPIGQKSIIETSDYETIRRFYRDWYRPDLMAVVAVGDFDRNRIESLIQQHFADLPVLSNSRKREYYPVPDHEETLVTIATDPEATYSSVSIYYKQAVAEEGTHGAYRRTLVQALHDGILNNRLGELLQQPEPPFRYAGVGEGRFVRTKSMYSMTAITKDNQIQTGLEALLIEAHRIRQFGVTPSELEREKADMLRSMEQTFRERDKTPSSGLAAEYLRNFLEDEPVPGIAYEYDLWKSYLPEITLEEVNAISQRLIREKNRVILVNAPEKEGITVPLQSELLGVFDRVEQMSIQAYDDQVSDAPLVEDLPVAGTITHKAYNSALDVTEWRLSNGIRLLFKITDFKNDQVLFRAFSPGGYSLYPDSLYIPAITASSIVGMSGLGQFDEIELDKKLAGKSVQVAPSIGDLSEGLRGSASPEDLETLFQLVHLYFTGTRTDSNAFLAYQSQIRGYLENRSANPETAFNDTIQVTLSNNHFRARPFSNDDLIAMNLDQSMAIYQDRFMDAGDFTFVFVGNIDTTELRQMATEYLANLPTANRSEQWRDVGMRSPDGIVAKTVQKGLEDKAQVRLYFFGPFDWNRQNRYDINAMASVMQIRLREVLREDQGGTYGVGVSASTDHYPIPEYQVRIAFGCAPDRVEELTRLVMAEIDSLQRFGTTDVYVQKVMESQRRGYELDLRQNSYWLSTLQFYLWHNEPLESINQTLQFIDGLEKSAIQKAAKSYLNLQHYAKFVLLPEKSGS